MTRRWLLHTWSSYFPVSAVTTMIWLISSIAAQELLYFWPVWVAGPWGVVLISQTIGGLAGDAAAEAGRRRSTRPSARSS